MLVKVLHTEGFTLYDDIDSVNVISQQVIVDESAVEVVEVHDHIVDRTKTVIEPTWLLLNRRMGKKDVVVKSDWPVYVMNDEGKTVEKFMPKSWPKGEGQEGV